MSRGGASRSWNGDKFSATVAGALRAAVHDHGPITDKGQHIASATKRVVGQLRHLGFEQAITDVDVEGHFERKYKRLAHGHERLLHRYEVLSTKLDALRAQIAGAAGEMPAVEGELSRPEADLPRSPAAPPATAAPVFASCESRVTTPGIVRYRP